MITQQEIKDTYILLLIIGFMNLILTYLEFKNIKVTISYLMGFVTGMYFVGTIK
jgi:hypothetical protein